NNSNVALFALDLLAVTTVPGQPTLQTATPKSSSEIDLAWTAPTSGGAPTSYNVYRGTTAGGEGRTAYKSGLTTTSYADTSCNASTTYYYTVAAVNSSGTGTQSAEQSATTQAATAPQFATGFESTNPQPTWNDTWDYIANVSGY